MVGEAAGFEGAMTRGQRIYVAAAIFCCVTPLLACPFASAAEPKHVIVLHSFGRDFKPWSDYARTIRMELNRQSPWPLDITEHSLVTALSPNEEPEVPFVNTCELFRPNALPT